jgi:hypothetical protein
MVDDGTVIDIESDKRRLGSDVAGGTNNISGRCAILRAMRCTHKETSCFQTGLWAEIWPKRPLPLERVEADGTDELALLPRRLASAVAAAFAAIALRADIALEGMPLTSLSASLVGSLLINSFCSNWTTT